MNNAPKKSMGSLILLIALIVANAAMLAAGIITIPPNFRNADEKEAAIESDTGGSERRTPRPSRDAATPLPSAAPEATPEPTPEVTPEPTPEPPVKVQDQELTLELSFEGELYEYNGEYTGETLDGLPQGQGIFTFWNDEGADYIYTGQWNAGRFEGEGELEFLTSGGSMAGTFKDGLLNGRGQSYYSNGALIFDGEYENGVMKSGALYDNSGGPYFEGEFRDGARVEDAAALSERIAGYKAESEPFAYKVWNDWESYYGTIVSAECEIIRQYTDSLGIPNISLSTKTRNRNQTYTSEFTSTYIPAYGEALPEEGDEVLAYFLIYEGVEGPEPQLLAID